MKGGRGSGKIEAVNYFYVLSLNARSLRYPRFIVRPEGWRHKESEREHGEGKDKKEGSRRKKDTSPRGGKPQNVHRASSKNTSVIRFESNRGDCEKKRGNPKTLPKGLGWTW